MDLIDAPYSVFDEAHAHPFGQRDFLLAFARSADHIAPCPFAVAAGWTFPYALTIVLEAFKRSFHGRLSM